MSLTYKAGYLLNERFKTGTPYGFPFLLFFIYKGVKTTWKNKTPFALR